MISSIIFTKNRPLQLDLCINSIKTNFPQCSEIIVIYCNDERFENAYQILSQDHDDVNFWKQSTSIFCDTYDAIDESNNDYICFFTDDCICYEKIKLPKDLSSVFISSVSCISLRVGVNIRTRWCENTEFPDINTRYGYSANGEFIYWNRTDNLYGSYWSYSLSVDGHIFRKTDLEEMFDELLWIESGKNWKQTPNEIESKLQRFWTDTPPLMVAPRTSKVVNSPNNRVQDSHAENRSGDVFDYSEDSLLSAYMEGKRINCNKLDFSNIECPHTELDILKGIE